MKNIKERILTSLVLFLFIYFSLVNLIFLFSLLILICFMALYEFNIIFNKIYLKKKLLKFLLNLLSLIYVSIFATSIWIYLSLGNSISKISIIFILLICISTDIGGYIFGKIIGGKKLTKISPNKTYSGAIGSIIFSLITGYLFLFLQNSIIKSEINFTFIILLVSILSQVGDLIISFLKRKAKMHDTGTILPGHGGILDRIDGLLLAMPLGLILISN